MRGNILGSIVDARPRSLLRMIRPVGCEDFECFSSQKEIKGFLPFLLQDFAHEFIRIGSLPSAVWKSAAGVLLRPAGSLDHAIECDKRQDDQFSHGGSFLLWQRRVSKPGTCKSTKACYDETVKPGEKESVRLWLAPSSKLESFYLPPLLSATGST